ncbi:MAG TPA: potassium channel family protein [Candidatus Sulfotelmatobacter sp.]|nr:potassium channel family protein [Candidatus Sulfotelmatobacter sp.]
MSAGRLRTALAPYRDQALTALVAFEAIWLFVLSPLGQVHVLPNWVNALTTAVIVAVVLVVCSGTTAAELAVVAATLVDLVATLLRHQAPSHVTLIVDLLSRLLFLFAVTAVVARAVFARGDVTHHRILGAIAVYLNIAWAFAYIYRALDALVPGSFSGNHVPTADVFTIGRFVYFSFTTMTSTGFGDIIPIHPFARSATNLEALMGQLFPATLLARLVSLEIEYRRTRGGED